MADLSQMKPKPSLKEQYYAQKPVYSPFASLMRAVPNLEQNFKEVMGRVPMGGKIAEMLTAPVDPLAMATFGGQKATGFAKAEGKFSNLADKMPRFEISDKGAEAIDLITARNLADMGINKQPRMKLKDILNHEELYKQYPELKDISVTLNNNLDSGAQYMHMGGVVPQIVVNPRKIQEMGSTLLHEIQHAIQEKEGFARGGSLESISSSSDRALARIKFLNSELSRLAKEMDTVKGTAAEKELGAEYDAAMAEKMNLWDEATTFPYRKYRNLAGEIEARDVSARMGFTPEQRMRTGPYTSEDIPLKDWITRMGK